ncbi:MULTISPECIES: hypothetical protein [Vibrio]|uniref:NAD(+)--protein-arginine ADP-ribosyltransferase n=1 Tax=Vibrio sp. DAT722 TaxID=344879 RepID=Q2FA11_9VIBR|nr:MULTISPECIES: hypothetical protein [Vibrio]ABA55860.1 hypothetical protein [Vibrio sp. DAT722]EKY4197872.1 hypothetical protein [Vibrio harveyi]MCG7518019.1 hypothetical protein [Vibrio sp. MMH1-50]TXM07031.1 hypothetical protein FVP09_24780 [Vibrio parahaemolyticus]
MDNLVQKLKSLAYDEKRCQQVISKFSLAERKEALNALAQFENINEERWILNIVYHISPQIHDFIDSYTSGAYTRIREHQRGIQYDAKLGKLISDFMANSHMMPKYLKSCRHYSKSTSWYDYFSVNDTLELDSFMSCARESSDFSYVLKPEAILVFNSCKQGFYLGAMTRESCEREVLFPAGSRFKLSEVRGNQYLLEEIA